MLENIFFLLLAFLSPKVDITYTREYVLPTEEIPLNVYWISEDNLLLSYSTDAAEIYNLESGKRNKLDECTDCVYGYDGEILRCDYVNKEVHRPEDPGTTISLYNSQNELIFQQDLYHFLEPFVCKRDKILLWVNNPVLQDGMFSLDTKTGELTEYQVKHKNVYLEGLPEYKNISVGGKRILLLTEEDLLAVYRREKF